MTLSSPGLVSGTPTTAGIYNFTIQVTDSAGATASTPFQLTINSGALAITSASPLPVGRINAAYSQTLTAAGGAPPYANWTTSSGALPAGLTLSSAGVLSGTPTTAGTYSFTVQMRDNASATASAPFQLTITSAALSITTTSPLPAGKVNTGYSLTLAASGGAPPYSNWSTSNGTLPPGLTLSSAGVWSGTPTTAGTYSFTVQVTDNSSASASASFQLTINPALANHHCVASARSAGECNRLLAIVHGDGWDAAVHVDLQLAGRQVCHSGAGGVWNGTPRAAGTYSFMIQVTDSAGGSASASFQLTVKQPAPNVAAAVSSANVVAGLPVTAGSWVALYGSNLAPAGDSRTWNSATEIVNGMLPTEAWTAPRLRSMERLRRSSTFHRDR